MSINCEITLRWDAKPEHLKALGAALWEWCSGAAGDAGIYPYLDNQALADLLTGRSPAPPGWGQGPPRVQFLVRGDPVQDRQATLESLCRRIPSEGVMEVRVDGIRRSAAKAEQSPDTENLPTGDGISDTAPSHCARHTVEH
jgi:hypothetical protein